MPIATGAFTGLLWGSWQELIAPERMAAVSGLPGVPDLLHYVLVRDPRRRPSLADVAHRCACCSHWQLPLPCSVWLAAEGKSATIMWHRHLLYTCIPLAGKLVAGSCRMVLAGRGEMRDAVVAALPVESKCKVLHMGLSEAGMPKRTVKNPPW